MKQELWGYYVKVTAWMISSNKSRSVEIKFFKYKVNRIKILLKLISEENAYFLETYGNMAYMY